jgi:class 3 adenylate cyclase
VVGDLVGSGDAQERGIVGETPNLAARLQSMALDDGIAISIGTRDLLGRLFELDELGSLDLKGFAKPVQAFRVIRPSAGHSSTHWPVRLNARCLRFHKQFMTSRPLRRGRPSRAFRP